ncbi:MAG: hypothetical protein V2A69_15610 [Pseudomonadota bacterium]
MKTKRYSIFFLFWFLTYLLICPISFLQAGEPIGWQDLGLYGGQIYAIAIDPVNSNTIFAGSYYGDGLFKTTDGGQSWQPVEVFRNQVVYSIAFFPNNHSTIWVATAYYIYKSEDGGEHWKFYDPALTPTSYYYYYTLTLDPNDNNTIYVGTSGPYGDYDGGRVYKTANGGETWQETSLIADHNVWDLAVNPKNSQEIWAITGPEWVSEGSIYRTRDGGGTWSKIETGLAAGWFYVLVINPKDPNIIFVGGEKGVLRTKNGGATWSQRDPDSSCRGLVLDPESPSTIYASWYNTNLNKSVLSKSSNGGDKWTTYDIEQLELICLSMNPQNNQVLYCGDANLGVYKSNDGGVHWQAASQGIKANHVFDSAQSSEGRIVVGTYSGLYLEREGGGWESLLPFICRAVSISPENNHTIYAGFDWAFARSFDFGEHWALTYIPSNDPNSVSSLAISHQNSNTLYLGVSYESGDRGEIYKSTDSGETIRLIHSLEAPVNTVRVSPHNSQVIFAGSGMFYAPIKPGGVYKSTDGGGSWEELTTGIIVNTFAFDPQNPEILYAGCGSGGGSYSGLFKSTDGGETWEEKDFGIPEGAAIVDLGIDSDNNNTLYAATSRHGIYISYDAGNYWTRLGLSDYWLFDVLVGASSPTASKKITPGKTSLPSSNLYAGSGSGILEFTGGGIGIVSGMVADTETGSGITGATLSTDTGGAALSLSGYYVMVVPAGSCTVTGYTEGYNFFSSSGVVVTTGNETTADLSLKPLAKVNIKNIELETNGAIQVNQPITLKVEVESASTPYYQYWVASGYGTSAYGNWTLLKSYTTENTLTWSPLTQDHYVLVVWVTDDISLHAPQMGGLSAAVGQGTELQIKSISSDITASSTFSTPINLLTTTFGNSISYYQYWVTSSYGCPPTVQSWEAIGNYSIDNRGVWTPTEGGHYVLVVHVSDDPETSIPEIAGMTCVINE